MSSKDVRDCVWNILECSRLKLVFVSILRSCLYVINITTMTMMIEAGSVRGVRGHKQAVADVSKVILYSSAGLL